MNLEYQQFYIFDILSIVTITFNLNFHTDANCKKNSEIGVSFLYILSLLENLARANKIGIFN